MMNIQFDLSIRPTTALSDRQRLEIALLDTRELRRFAKGKIFLTIDNPRNFMVIDSEVLDYLDQLKGVIRQIDIGNHKTFTVSGDYFSNSLDFTYTPSSKMLTIYEANGGDFTINLPYRDFKSAFLSFYDQAMTDIQIIYPELRKNKEFIQML